VLLASLYRAALEHVHVRGFPKVTGQRGIQIWIPIEPGPSFEDTRAWVEVLSRASKQVLQIEAPQDGFLGSEDFRSSDSRDQGPDWRSSDPFLWTPNPDRAGDRAISCVILDRSCRCSSADRRRTLGRGGLADKSRGRHVGEPFCLVRHL
jgi:hypothetical protein